MRTLWEPSEWNNIGYCSDTMLYKILLRYFLRHELSGIHDSIIALRLIRLNIANLNQAEHVKLKILISYTTFISVQHLLLTKEIGG